MPDAAGRLRVCVRGRQVETPDGVALEIDLNQNRGLVTDHAGIVAGVDEHGLRRGVHDGAPIRVFDLHLTLHEKADVCVHAQCSAHRRSEVRRPAITGRIHDALDASIAGLDNILIDATDAAVYRTGNGSDERICGRVSHGDRLSSNERQVTAA